MAQVTMDSKEYLELIAAQKELEHLKKALLDGFKFEYSPESYRKYKCEFQPELPADIVERITNKVLEECLSNPGLMKALNDDSETVFDIKAMQMCRDWGDKDPYFIHLLEYPDFQAAYAKCEEEEEE